MQGTHFRGGGLCSPSKRAECCISYLEPFGVGDLSPPLHSLTRSFNRISTASGYAELIFRTRQEGIVLLLVHVQRTEDADGATGESLASLVTMKVSLTHQAQAHDTELPAAITL